MLTESTADGRPARPGPTSDSTQDTLPETLPDTPFVPLMPGPLGLVCAFRFAAGAAQALDWQDVTGNAQPDDAQPGDAAFDWIHVKSADSRIRDWLEAHPAFDDDVRALLRTENPHAGIHITDTGIYGTLIDMSTDVGGADSEKGAMHFFLDAAQLITIRTKPLQSTDRLRHKVRDGAQFADSGALFAALVQCLATGFSLKLEHLTDQIDDIEDSVLADRKDSDRSDLSTIRRQLAELRRYLNPERNSLGHFNVRVLHWAAEDARDDLGQAIHRLNSIGATADALYERAKLLHEEIAAQMSEEMNRNLLVLSVMTAMLLPATLVSGIFGMNVAGLPGLHDQTSFWWVLGVMVLLGLGTLALLRRLRLVG